MPGKWKMSHLQCYSYIDADSIEKWKEIKLKSMQCSTQGTYIKGKNDLSYFGSIINN